MNRQDAMIAKLKQQRDSSSSEYNLLGRRRGGRQAAENKYDPRNHTKPHEMDALIRVASYEFVDRFTACITTPIFIQPLKVSGRLALKPTATDRRDVHRRG